MPISSADVRRIRARNFFGSRRKNPGEKRMNDRLLQHADDVREAFGKEVTDLVYTFRVRLSFCAMAEVLQQIAEELSLPGEKERAGSG
jgi:hypothetical protein